MISIELWRARIGQFNGKCRSRSSLYFWFSFLFDPYSRCRKNDVSSQDPDPSSLTTAVASEDSTKRLSPSISSPVSSSISSSSSDLSQLSTTSHISSCSFSSGSCSIKSTLGSSSWLSVLFSFLPSCSFSYYSGVCRSVLRETPLIILLIAGIISHQLIICAGDVETNPGPIASDRPKQHELIKIKNSDGTKLEVIQWITSHEQWRCIDFADMLLKEDALVRRYKNSNMGKDEFVRTVLRNWLSRDDDDSTDSAVPRTWSALAECVSDAGLDGALVKAIRDTCPSPATGQRQYKAGISVRLTKSQTSQLDTSEGQAQQSDVTNSPPPHPFTTYQQYLKDLYSAEYPEYSKQQFTVNRPKQIVNLVLVHREKNEGDKLQRECLLYQLHGNIDLLQQKKTPLTKDQITVLASGATARRVLIEGAPGIGKTTLLWQLCHQWANGELLQQWELVILVQLRDETTRTAQCLSDLLYHPDDNISKAVCHIVERREGENILFIFDGYDELSDDQRTDSLFIRLLRRECRELRKATVVVSSRPFATKTLPHQFKNSLDQHVEIVGFNEQDIETYLTSACENSPEMLRDLNSYISTQAFISSVLYNPLHCTIVTELYLQYWQRGEKGFAPNTLTQLYEAFVLNLLRRHLCLDNTPSWTDLPSDVSHQLNQLGKLAARGIEQRKCIFDNVPSDTLSLMHSVKPLHEYRPNHPISHTFTHLTLQEFLAGHYWSQLPPQQLTEVLQRHDLFPIQQYISRECTAAGG